MLKNNCDNLRELQLSNLPQAVTDKIMMHISGLDHLRFLDVSFAHQITDGGLMNFNDKQLPIKQLFLNGLKQVSSVGLTSIIHSC